MYLGPFLSWLFLLTNRQSFPFAPVITDTLNGVHSVHSVHKQKSEQSIRTDALDSVIERQIVSSHQTTRRVLLGFISSYPLVLKSIDCASAAPPISIIAEEFGYFPVTSKTGHTVYVPSRVRRGSTIQSIELASYLKKINAIMVGAYWCPHCRHQKELFGSEAWSMITYVEAAPRGYGFDQRVVDRIGTKLEGFPTWIFPTTQGRVIYEGEASLGVLARASKYNGKFDEALEPQDSSSIGSCR